jgi:hypothetical protein
MGEQRMAMYLTRVELHDADEDKDYKVLHEAMEKRGFVRTIVGDIGKVEYHLPTAEYYRESSLPVETIRDEASTAARTTGRRFGVIVAEAKSLAWVGLDKVEKEADSKN